VNDLPNHGVTDEMSTRISFSVTNRLQCFVIMKPAAENSVSHKYVVTKGSTSFIALSDKLG